MLFLESSKYAKSLILKKVEIRTNIENVKNYIWWNIKANNIKENILPNAKIKKDSEER